MSLEFIQNLDNLLVLVILVLLIIGSLIIGFGIKQISKGKLVSAGFRSLSGTSLILLGLLILSVSSNLYSYQRLTHERKIAELSSRKIDKQKFEIHIFYQDGIKPDRFEIQGDEWQIDARIIKWKGWAQLMGLEAQYKLERISGRYQDIEQEKNDVRSVYALFEKDKIDYWNLMNKYKKWLPWVDAYYGSATYLPLADNARYSLSISQSGLIARPVDIKTEEIIKNW